VVEHRFETKVEPHGKTATFLHVPPEVMEALGPKKRVPVRVTINGYTYRSTVAPMSGVFLLPLNRQNRTGAKVSAGDVVEVAIERDDASRMVDVPDDLAAALAVDEKANEVFGRLSYTHQREYVEWISEAKRSETRTRRVGQAVERLKAGETARG
jgi:uncharacterized protein YdeI (YjbR/CyaY-like superfamily)